MDNLEDVKKAFVQKRKELQSTKTLISFCVDTRCLLQQLIDLATDPSDIEMARAFSTSVKHVQADAEVNQYLTKWEITV